jgi:hypothetical protein
MAKDTNKTVPTVPATNVKDSTATRQVSLQVQDGRLVADTNPGVVQ